ncbi:hypothetical protein LEP1GSC192_1787 [Leptospira sp. B5-022]|nr:hypothetical protein LEP1GSC192_1787 [Leptospira sp. B5-022]
MFCIGKVLDFLPNAENCNLNYDKFMLGGVFRTEYNLEFT